MNVNSDFPELVEYACKGFQIYNTKRNYKASVCDNAFEPLGILIALQKENKNHIDFLLKERLETATWLD